MNDGAKAVIPVLRFYDHEPGSGRPWSKRCDTSVEITSDLDDEQRTVRGTVMMADEDLILAIEQDNGTTLNQIAMNLTWDEWDRFVVEVNRLRHSQKQCWEELYGDRE